MKHVIKKYQVVYSSGNRDKVNLEVPIVTNDLEATRTKIRMKHTGRGITCVGVNFDYDEINTDSV